MGFYFLISCIHRSALNFLFMIFFHRYRYIPSQYLRTNMTGMEWVTFFTSSYQRVIQRNFHYSFRKISWWDICVTLTSHFIHIMSLLFLHLMTLSHRIFIKCQKFNYYDIILFLLSFLHICMHVTEINWWWSRESQGFCYRYNISIQGKVEDIRSASKFGRNHLKCSWKEAYECLQWKAYIITSSA